MCHQCSTYQKPPARLLPFQHACSVPAAVVPLVVQMYVFTARPCTEWREDFLPYRKNSHFCFFIIFVWNSRLDLPSHHHHHQRSTYANQRLRIP